MTSTDLNAVPEWAKLSGEDIQAHAKLGPSAAESWMTCPDWPNAVEGLHNGTSEFSAEGTAAHSISDDCLTFGMTAYDFIGSTLTVEGEDDDGVLQRWSFTWTEDDAEHMQPGLDEIMAFEGTFYGEQRVDLSGIFGVPGQFGTLDRAVVGPKLIVIDDLKWGRGIAVSPVRNKQLMIYGLGFWRNIARHVSDATEFLFIIDQPRNGDGGGHWRCTLDDMLAFEREVHEAAQRTLQPNPPRVASEKGCYWCLRRKQPPTEPGAISGCKTFDEFTLDLMGSRFDDIDGANLIGAGFTPPPYDSLSAERRAWIVRNRKTVEKWLEMLHTALIQDGLNGDPTPGLKVIDGRRGRKKWVNEKAADKYLADPSRLGEDRFTIKLKSPSQALKSLPVEERLRLIDSGQFVQGDPKPVLVDENDDRPAKATVDDKFAKLESDEEELL